ncbi:MAG: ABC transporter permease subunit, partial [Lachnospiraceae bacterium]|nr:ABC transporter permease subunit [Lachnospiraceae bacterium]
MASFSEKFYQNFIEDNRWSYLTSGLKNTLVITVFALLIGVLLGFLIAVIRTTCDKTGHMKFLNIICKVYLTVIRGTPVMVQLLIIYYVTQTSHIKNGNRSLKNQY